MSFFHIFDIAGSGMAAQSIRLNTTASNLANVDSVSGDSKSVYRAREPVFSAVQERSAASHATPGVRVLGIVESATPVGKRHEPANPLADKDGYVYTPNVNGVEEMVNMLSAARSYQNNVEIMDTTKSLMMRTLDLGK